MLYYVNIDLHHQYGISLDKAQMSLAGGEEWEETDVFTG